MANIAEIDLSDINLVVIIADGFQLPSPATLTSYFERREFGKYIKQPVSMAQAINIDQGRSNANVALQFESMRSQRIVSFSPQRLSVHDRTGDIEHGKVALAELTALTTAALDITGIRAIGGNVEIAIRAGAGDTRAAKIIASKLLHTPSFGEGYTLNGASTRIFLFKEPYDLTLTVDPLNNDVVTPDFRVTCNCNFRTETLPTAAVFEALIDEAYTVASQAVRLFVGDSEAT